MKKVKEFDCVEMKNQIQAKLIEHYKGMTEAEIEADQNHRIEANPVLGPLFRKLRKGHQLIHAGDSSVHK